MNHFFHLFRYLFFRQLSWVIGYWSVAAVFVYVVAFSSLYLSGFFAALLFGVLVMMAVVIVIQIHDHLDRQWQGGVLRGRPIRKKSLLVAELSFIGGALMVPVIAGTLVILASFDAKAVSYLIAGVLWTVVASQLVLWYVAGGLSRTVFRTFLLILGYYLPVFAVWSVVEYANDNQAFDMTILLALAVTGFLSLVLLFLSTESWKKRVLFLFSAGALLVAMSGVHWGSGQYHWTDEEDLRGHAIGNAPGPGETTSVEFAVTPPVDADPMKDSHWYYFQISTDRKDEIFIPNFFLGGEMLKKSSKLVRYFGSYRDYSWQLREEALFGDVILRNFPEGTDLRTREATVRFRMSEGFSEGPEVIVIPEGETATLHGQKVHLTHLGGMPLREGLRESLDGYRVSIRKVTQVANKLSVSLEAGRVFDTFARPQRVSARSRWVLFSPSLKSAVLTKSRGAHVRRGISPLFVEKLWMDLEFPLPEILAGAEDLELHGFFLDGGEYLKFDVLVPAGEYSHR